LGISPIELLRKYSSKNEKDSFLKLQCSPPPYNKTSSKLFIKIIENYKGALKISKLQMGLIFNTLIEKYKNAVSTKRIHSIPALPLRE